MNRTELAARVARRLGTSAAQGASAADAVLTEIATELAAGGHVSLRGFGVFIARNRAARRLLHPSSGEPINLAPHRTVHFRPGAALLRLVGGGQSRGRADDGDIQVEQL